MSLKNVYLFGLFALLTIAGCSGYRTTSVMPEPRPLAEDYESYIAPERLDKTDTAYNDQKAPGDTITLAQALSLALLHNPSLAAFSYEIRAAEARTLQAGLYPNPELEFELEEFAGSRELSGLGSSEITGALSQTILLGGKRYKSMKAAALESDLISWDYESARLDVFTEVRQAFIKVLAAQERVKLNEELLRLSEQLLKSILQRVEAGRISPAEASRARVTLANTRVELERARRELEAARQRLAAAWGSDSPFYNAVTGELDTLVLIPAFEKLIPLLEQNPDLARYFTASEQAQAVIDLEDALRIPDPTIRGGVKRLNEIDDNAFVVGLSIPIPLTDRNQGSRQEARFRLAQTQNQQRATKVALNVALTQTYQDLQSTENEIISLRKQILPESENAYRVINEGYLQGRFDFLDVLDAQRTLFESRGQYLSALTDFHQTVIEIERLVSQEINTIE
jgi:cobalt-zinc-cadmium efflux system outer membrane protein